MEEGIRFGRMRGSSPLPIFKIGAIDQLCQPSKKNGRWGRTRTYVVSNVPGLQPGPFAA